MMALRMSRSGILAVAAVVLAAGTIGYRILSDERAAPPSAVAAPGPLAELQQRTQAAPNDAEAWQKLGFAQFGQENYAAAAAAYERATGLSPRNAVLWSSLGEARVMASERDPMPPAALAAFRQAIALDPKDPRARYFLAVEQDLRGDHQGAISSWLALLKETPPGAPWDADLQRTIEQVGKINRIDVERQIASATAARPASRDAAMPEPSPAQLAAATALPPGEQQAMAEAMVARLAQKLKANPANVDGWIMLVRSYRTLHRDDKAKAALAQAIAANPDHADDLRANAAALGVTG
jgi:cytochrome c-type biogenesis protein CcmH